MGVYRELGSKLLNPKQTEAALASCGAKAEGISWALPLYGQGAVCIGIP